MRASSTLTILVSAILLLIAAPGTSSAQSNNVITDSELFFSVLGPEKGRFSIASVDSEVLRYELGPESQIVFRLYDHAIHLDDQGSIVFDNPLFCFDFDPSGESLVNLAVQNSSGQVVLERVGLASDLAYQVSDGEIVFTPSDSTQCFYVDASVTEEDATFGLFGVAPAQPEDDQNAEGRIFADGFQIIESPRVSVFFKGVPDSVAAGDTLVYDIVIENPGDVALNQLAFQEVFPGNAAYFPASLQAGTWNCLGTACPESAGIDSIRWDSISLPVGASIRYEVSRTVDPASTAGSTLVLYAGVVDGPGREAPYDVSRTKEVVVIGAPARLAFTSDNSPVAVGSTKSLTVEVQDADGNRVPGDERTIQIAKVDGSGPGEVTFNEFQLVSNGTAEFSVTGREGGNLTLIAVTQTGSAVDPGQISFEVTQAP